MKEMIERQIELLETVNIGLLIGRETNQIDIMIARLNESIGRINETKYPITECSPKAMRFIDDKTTVGTGDKDAPGINAKYPLNELLIGQSFSVKFSDGKTRGCLDSCTRSLAQRTGKIFKVVSHAELGLFEVARIG